LHLARDAGLGITLHAGEADVAERVLEAGRLGARRNGHGVRLAYALHDPARRDMVEEVVALGLHLEICPTSNVHTGAAASLAAHPLRQMLNAGLSVSLSTDNRLMSGVSLSDEWRHAAQAMGLDAATLLATNRAAAQASFMPAAVRTATLAAIDPLA
jgi:adenosine deaminase